MCQNLSLINETLQSCILKNCPKGISGIWLLISISILLIQGYFIYTVSVDILENYQTRIRDFVFSLKYLSVIFTGIFLPLISGDLVNYILIGSIFVINIDIYIALIKLEDKYQNKTPNNNQNNTPNNNQNNYSNNNFPQVIFEGV